MCLIITIRGTWQTFAYSRALSYHIVFVALFTYYVLGIARMLAMRPIAKTEIQLDTRYCTNTHTHIEPSDVSLHQLAGVIRLTLRESIASSILTYMIYHWYNKMHSLSWNTGACSANKLNSKKATCQTMWKRKFSSCRQRFWKRLLLISEDREKERTLKTLCHSFNGERNVKLADIGCLWLAYVVFRTFDVWGRSKSEYIKKNNFSISPGILTLNICFCVTLFQLLLWIYTRRVCVGSN